MRQSFPAFRAAFSVALIPPFWRCHRSDRSPPNFIFHAPFLLTDSREGIRAGVPHNDKMVQLLADLAADAFEYLRDIGKGSSVRLIEDSVVDFVPVDPGKFSLSSDKQKISCLPFYQTIKGKFEEADLLPSTEGYVSSKDA